MYGRQGPTATAERDKPLDDFRLRFLRLICNSYIIRHAADSPVEFIDFIWESVASFVKLGNSKRRSRTWRKIGPQPFEH